MPPLRLRNAGDPEPREGHLIDAVDVGQIGRQAGEAEIAHDFEAHQRAVARVVVPRISPAEFVDEVAPDGVRVGELNCPSVACLPAPADGGQRIIVVARVRPIPGVAAEQEVLLGEAMVQARRPVSVGVEGTQELELQVLRAERVGIGLVRQRVEPVLDFQRDGVQPRGGNALARKRRVVVEGVADGGRLGAEVARPPHRNRNRGIEVREHLRAAGRLERVEEEALVVAIVDFWQVDRTADGSAWVVAHAGAALCGERISGAEPGRRVVVEDRAVDLVRSALRDDRHLADPAILGGVVRHVDADLLEGLDLRNQRRDLGAVVLVRQRDAVDGGVGLIVTRA